MKFILADRQTSARSALRLLLEQYPRMEYAGETGEAGDLLNLTASSKPELALVEWELLAPRPQDRIAELKAICPLIVVVLNSSAARNTPALAVGADYYVSKRDNPELLISFLDGITAGHKE
ncbi:MAG: hypothetical protein ACRKGH_05100 [Dehalogenimonas sp.]